MKTTQLLKSRMQQTELREREDEQASYPRRNKDGSKKTYQDFNNEILAFCYWYNWLVIGFSVAQFKI